MIFENIKTLDDTQAELDNWMLNEGYAPMVYGNDIDEDVAKRNPCPKCGEKGALYQSYESASGSKRGFAVCQNCFNVEEF